MTDDHKPALAAFVLAGVIALCITVLAALQVDVPEVLGYALTATASGGAGLAAPALARRKAS